MNKPEADKTPKLYGKLSLACTLAQKRRLEIVAAKHGQTTAQYLRDRIEILINDSESQEEPTS
jgi:predicted DNA-binding protein